MSRYDDLFDATAAEDSVFADKSALDPLAEPTEVVPRDTQETALATILSGVQEGYLPTTVSIYGPPGTGKTVTTRRLCREFAARTPAFAYEYVNLKECRTLFAAANEIHRVLTGETKGAYVGLDGVFEGIWEALEDYPEWVVLVLDEIDHIQHDSNYNHNDFFYRLLRGEGKLKRDLQLSVFLMSNELLEVDLHLDSRVQSAMSGEEVFFPPYGVSELLKMMQPRLTRAFRDGMLTEDAVTCGIHTAARRWGDARKTLRLFRQAGETANERELDRVTKTCVEDSLEATEQEDVTEKIINLPAQHFTVLFAACALTDRQTGEIVQPVTADQVQEAYGSLVDDEEQLSTRALRDIVTDLETMGIFETWIESRGSDGRVKQIETPFDPAWVQEAAEEYSSAQDQVDITVE